VVETYRRVWSAATGIVVVIGCLVPVVVWCVVSPWTFTATLTATCWAWRASSREAHRAVRVLGTRIVAAPLAEDRGWRLLRLLPAVPLAAVGWHLLLGATGTALLLVDAVYAAPLLARDRKVRWPDGRDVGQVPDTVEELDRPACSEVSSAATSTASTSWPGPRTLLPDLDDEELLHAWESSTRALELGPTPAALLSIVAARARYLDALVERDPEGVARRLALGQQDDWTFDSPA
jgi:hypothetical protein